MVAVTAKVVLRALTIAPEFGKWTKLGPCVDSTVLLKVIHNLLLHLVEESCKGMVVEIPQPPQDGEHVDAQVVGFESIWG